VKIDEIIDEVMAALDSLSPQGIVALIVMCAAGTVLACLFVQGGLVR